jgi:hypothetical protein
MAKKIWDTLEASENCNALYIGGVQSLLYTPIKDNCNLSQEQVASVLHSLSIQDSIIQEFDGDAGLDAGNAVLAGFCTEYGLERIMNGGSSSYRVAYSQACDRISKRKKKNKNEKRQNKEGEIETLDDYVTSGTAYHLQRDLQKEKEQLQAIRETINNGTRRQKQQATKKLARLIEAMEIDGVKFATKTTTTKQTTRAKFKTLVA